MGAPNGTNEREALGTKAADCRQCRVLVGDAVGKSVRRGVHDMDDPRDYPAGSRLSRSQFKRISAQRGNGNV